jgi:hypothetical protein
MVLQLLLAEVQSPETLQAVELTNVAAVRKPSLPFEIEEQRSAFAGLAMLETLPQYYSVPWSQRPLGRRVAEVSLRRCRLPPCALLYPVLGTSVVDWSAEDAS